MSTPPTHELCQAAVARREALDLGDTDARRLIDGEGDGLPGITLEDFAGRWLLSTREPDVPPDLRDWLAARDRPVYWKVLDRDEKESPRHLAGPEAASPFEIRESGMRFHIRFDAGYSQGIFLDQRDNRRRVRDHCTAGHTVLNTFAYTGAFSVAAALGGATTTTLDLSQPYLDWARDNLRLNGIDPESHHFIRGDTFHWLQRFAKQGRTFTGIVLDPPTFSRNADGKVFRAEHGYGKLVALAAACLEPSGWLLCTTNCRRLAHAAFQKEVRHAAGPQFGRFHSYPMPPDFPGDPYLKTILALK